MRNSYFFLISMFLLEILCAVGNTIFLKHSTMIEKNELLKKISAIEESEESVIAIYSNHIQNVLRYSTLDEQVQSRILNMLKKLDADMQKQKSFTKALIESIGKSSKDVY